MQAPQPIKYSSRRGAQSATWTLPGMRGFRIQKQGGYWKAGYAFYTKPWREKMILHRAIRDQHFPTLRAAVQAAWAAAEIHLVAEQNR